MPVSLSMRVGAALLALCLLGACQAYRDGGSRTSGELIDDAAIQVRVKTRLLRDPAIKGRRLDVDVSRGVVTLSGRVADDIVRQRAMQLAAGVKGVARVEDRMQTPVRATPAPDEPAPQTPANRGA